MRCHRSLRPARPWPTNVRTSCFYLLLIADRTGIDLATAARHKLAKNAAKYPVAASRGSREKYNRLKHAARSADKD